MTISGAAAAVLLVLLLSSSVMSVPRLRHPSAFMASLADEVADATKDNNADIEHAVTQDNPNVKHDESKSEVTQRKDDVMLPIEGAHSLLDVYNFYESQAAMEKSSYSISDITSNVKKFMELNTNEDSAENEAVSGLDALRRKQQLAEFSERMRADPRTSMTVPQLIRYYGFGAEVHHVTTADGYILELHRLLGKKSSCAAGHRASPGQCRPVLLQHGLLGSSSAWVLNEPSKALGYILAERGYDVWLGNARGNTYSLNHTRLDVASREFWDFSFDEMGKYDLPAVIDYILRTTKFKKLHYVGHSMGTTMFWVMCHEHPQFSRDKVASMSALGPVAFVEHAVAPVMLLAPFNRPLEWFLVDVLHEYRLLDPDTLLTKLLTSACGVTTLAEIVCRNSVFLLIGYDKKDLDLNWLPLILSQINAGASTRTIVHFAQNAYDGRFAKFNFRSGNKGRYNQSEPPLYDLSRVTVPVLLKWGDNDFLADPMDVTHLKKKLTSCPVTDSEVTNPLFNHLDFLWGLDALKVVYDDVIKFIQKHS